MYGVVTRTPDELEWSAFDRGFYEVKDVTGRANAPVPDAVNTVSCFGDNAAADADPTLVAVDDRGRRATAEHPQFDWACICPTSPEYREGLLSIVDDCTAVSADVRLDEVGFPRPEYCHCDRCERAFEASEHDDWFAWRAAVITEFVADAVERIPGRTYLTLHPDPFPGHLYRRAGIDLDALEPLVDEFVVPLYDTTYETTYWLETIASGFDSRLETPFSVELYAVDIDVDALRRATTAVEPYGRVLFGYDASTAQAAIRRMRAEGGAGVSHGTPSSKN